MSREIVLRCPRCAEPTAVLEDRRPAWARIAAFVSVQWAEDGPGAPWEELNVAPIVGQHFLLRVHHPFRAAFDRGFWALFQPVLSRLNGWMEHPAELRSSCLARCDPCAVVSQEPASGVIRIQVRELLAVPDIAAHMAADSSGAAFGDVAGGVNLQSVRWGNLLYWESTLESDIGAWVVCHSGPDRTAVVLYGEWDFHHDMVYAGHRPLTARERAYLRQHVE